MSDPVQSLLAAFELLPDAEKQIAVVEILRRTPPAEKDVSAAGFDALADELFATLDAEAAARADR